MTLTTLTLGANNYISYASVAEADAYLAADPVRGATWAGLTNDQKIINLVASTRRMDLLDYSGTKVSATQEREWPRTGATCDGTPVTDTDVPIQLQDATILNAGSIAIDPTNANQGSSGSNVKRVQAGTAQVEFFQPTTQTSGTALQDDTAFEVVRCLLAGNGATASDGSVLGAKTFGNDGVSSFCDPRRPGLTQGFS